MTYFGIYLKHCVLIKEKKHLKMKSKPLLRNKKPILYTDILTRKKLICNFFSQMKQVKKYLNQLVVTCQ